MKVSRLIALLQTCPQDAEVVLSKDPEGNGFRRLDMVDDTLRVHKDELAGFYFEYVYDENDLREEELDFDEFERVVVLWP